MGPRSVPRHAASPLTSKFAWSTLVVFLNSVGGQLMGWIATNRLFHYIAPGQTDVLGVTDLGLATLYILISSMISTLGDLRVGTAYGFFVARGGQPSSLTSAYLVFRVFSLGVCALGFFLLTPLLAPILHIDLGPAGMAPLDLFLILPLVQTPSYIYGTLRASRGQSISGLWPQVIENALRAVLLVIVSFLWTSNANGATSPLDVLGLHIQCQILSATNAGVVTDMGIAYVIAAAVPFFLLFVHSFVSPNGLYRDIHLSGVWNELRSLFVFSTPLIGAMFLTYAVGSLPPFFVAAIIKTNPTGYLQAFSNANAFLLLLMFLPNAITVPLFPDMASLFVRGEHRELRRRTRKSLRWTVIILAPMILTMVVFRHVLLNDMYSSAIAAGKFDAEYALAVLAISALPQSLFRITGSVLDAVGQQKRELYLSAIQLIVLSAALVGFLWPTSPLAPLGVTGAAIAVLLSTTAGFLSNAWFLHRYVQVHPSPRPYITVFVAAAATFLLFSKTAVGDLGALFGQPNLVIPVSSTPVLIAVICAGTVLYAFLLAATGELTKDDVHEMAASLGVPKAIPNFLARFCWRQGWPDPPGDDVPLPGMPASSFTPSA